MRSLWADVVITTIRRGYNGYKPKVVVINPFIKGVFHPELLQEFFKLDGA